jgi:hypothetical protein|eukprot:gnl/Ergobibamus_cyprinoides/1756.p3 GENE.gnl/Ergobibamus_cyprinoides/1756~~gnl/Ergobibamus_cyprinoides/1756.p3  ORF type:complete len:128 (+),score=7.02 gnl/Ergobibamus_cyprinoides/1756:92-475(+)
MVDGPGDPEDVDERDWGRPSIDGEEIGRSGRAQGTVEGFADFFIRAPDEGQVIGSGLKASRERAVACVEPLRHQCAVRGLGELAGLPELLHEVEGGEKCGAVEEVGLDAGAERGYGAEGDDGEDIGW